MEAGSSREFGTEAHPLTDPHTGERIVFRRRARDTNGELLEVTLYSTPTGFVPAPHIHPNQEERLEISGAPMHVRIGDVVRRYEPGETAVVPRGTEHVVWNESGQNVTARMEFRPALDTETMFETYFGLAADGRVGKGGVRDRLHLLALARAFRREIQQTPSQQRFVAPLAFVVAPVASLLGFRARYDEYSGPPSVRSGR
jgi:quercetin dioxygenase-like cupin family protein